MKMQKQVGKGVKDKAKIVVPIAEKYEFTTVHSDLQLKYNR